MKTISTIEFKGVEIYIDRHFVEKDEYSEGGYWDSYRVELPNGVYSMPSLAKVKSYITRYINKQK